MHPNLYKLWIAWERFKSKYFWKPGKMQTDGIVGEKPAFREAAVELSQRGFDIVVFGHTHHAGKADLPEGRTYYNTGSWLMGTPFLEINEGRVELRRWARGMGELQTSAVSPVAELVQKAS